MRSFLFLIIALLTAGINPAAEVIRVSEKTANSKIIGSVSDFFCAADDFRFAFGKEENTVSTGSNLKNDTKKYFTFSSPETLEQPALNYFSAVLFASVSERSFPFYLLFRKLLL